MQPLGRWLWLLTALVSMPLWPRVSTAVQLNDASVLFTPEVGTHAAMLAAPVIALAVFAHGVIAGVSELRFRLHRQQDDEAGAEAEHCPSCASDGGYGTAVEGRQYRCPECDVLWSPRSDGKSVRTRYGAWVQEAKIRLTSR